MANVPGANTNGLPRESGVVFPKWDRFRDQQQHPGSTLEQAARTGLEGRTSGPERTSLGSAQLGRAQLGTAQWHEVWAQESQNEPLSSQNLSGDLIPGDRRTATRQPGERIERPWVPNRPAQAEREANAANRRQPFGREDAGGVPSIRTRKDSVRSTSDLLASRRDLGANRLQRRDPIGMDLAGKDRKEIGTRPRATARDARPDEPNETPRRTGPPRGARELGPERRRVDERATGKEDVAPAPASYESAQTWLGLVGLARLEASAANGSESEIEAGLGETDNSQSNAFASDLAGSEALGGAAAANQQAGAGGPILAGYGESQAGGWQPLLWASSNGWNLEYFAAQAAEAQGNTGENQGLALGAQGTTASQGVADWVSRMSDAKTGDGPASDTTITDATLTGSTLPDTTAASLGVALPSLADAAAAFGNGPGTPDANTTALGQGATGAGLLGEGGGRLAPGAFGQGVAGRPEDPTLLQASFQIRDSTAAVASTSATLDPAQALAAIRQEMAQMARELPSPAAVAAARRATAAETLGRTLGVDSHQAAGGREAGARLAMGLTGSESGRSGAKEEEAGTADGQADPGFGSANGGSPQSDALGSFSGLVSDPGRKEDSGTGLPSGSFTARLQSMSHADSSQAQAARTLSAEGNSQLDRVTQIEELHRLQQSGSSSGSLALDVQVSNPNATAGAGQESSLRIRLQQRGSEVTMQVQGSDAQLARQIDETAEQLIRNLEDRGLSLNQWDGSNLSPSEKSVERNSPLNALDSYGALLQEDRDGKERKRRESQQMFTKRARAGEQDPESSFSGLFAPGSISRASRR